MVVDENKRRIITAVEAGGPYESEVEMLRRALKKLEPQKGLPFIADKGYDAVDIIESLLDGGFEPAIRIKETMRMSIRHPLRKLSKENWKRYGKVRYRVEQLFGSIKQKIGSSFKLLREDLARKASIACAILWEQGREAKTTLQSAWQVLKVALLFPILGKVLPRDLSPLKPILVEGVWGKDEEGLVPLSAGGRPDEEFLEEPHRF
jgi:hypothetical protein